MIVDLLRLYRWAALDDDVYYYLKAIERRILALAATQTLEEREARLMVDFCVPLASATQAQVHKAS